MPRPPRTPVAAAVAVAVAAVAALCLLTGPARALVQLSRPGDPAVLAVNNVDVPYGCAAYSVDVPAPFVQLPVAAGCVLGPDAPAIDASSAAVAYVDFDAATGLGCTCYADLFEGVFARAAASTERLVFVVSQSRVQQYSPGLIDYYCAPAAYAAAPYAITVISASDGAAVRAALAASATQPVLATATSGVNAWAGFATLPGTIAVRVFQSVTCMGALLFAGASLWLSWLAKSPGLANLCSRPPVNVRILGFLLCFFAFRFVQAAVDPINSSRLLGPFSVRFALLYAGFFCEVCAFTALLSGWSRAAAWAHTDVDRRYKLLWAGLLWMTVLMFFVASSVLVASATAARTNTVLDRAVLPCIGVIAVVLIVLCISTISIGARLLRILDPTLWIAGSGGTRAVAPAASRPSPERMLMLRKISVLVIVASSALIALLIVLFAPQLFFLTAATFVGVLWAESVLTLLIALAIMFTLRYESFSSTSSSNTGNTGNSARNNFKLSVDQPGQARTASGSANGHSSSETELSPDKVDIILSEIGTNSAGAPVASEPDDVTHVRLWAAV